MTILEQIRADICEPGVVSRGKMPYHCDELMHDDEHSLNGKWKFRYQLLPEFQDCWVEEEFDDTDWREMPVPGQWQLNGCDHPYYLNHDYLFSPDILQIHPPIVPEDRNHVGVYRRTFEVETLHPEKRTILKIDGVESSVHIFVNGQFAGFTQNGKTFSEFDITERIRQGKNLLVLCVEEFSAGAFLQCQDMWRMCGITRGVSLYETDPVRVYDCFAFSKFDADRKNAVLNLEVKMLNQTSACCIPLHVKARLRDAEGQIVAEGTGVTGNHSGRWDEVNMRDGSFKPTSTPLYAGTIGTAYVLLKISEPQLWYPDRPYLYRVELALTDGREEHPDSEAFLKRGMVLPDCLKQEAKNASFAYGFREIKVGSVGEILLNGKRILLKGVNRHEFSPESGRVLTEEEMIRDIRMMKRYNINAVRCSHYPNQDRWYALCDQYGLMVMDEADVETHGISYRANVLPGNDQRWLPIFLDRMDSMLQSHKNHVSILMWSIGNELGFGETVAAMASYLRSQDPTRLVHKRQMGSVADVDSETYPSVSNVASRGKSRLCKPFILNEYAHSMGNAMGSFDDYWRVIRQYPKVSGGFIWEWMDHGIHRIDRNGTSYFAYGGDYGEALSGSNFCMDGVVTADRQVTPKLLEVSHVHAPIVLKSFEEATGTLELENEFPFLSLNAAAMKAWVETNGLPIGECTWDEPLDAPALTTQTIHLTLPDQQLSPAGSRVLRIAFSWKEDQPFCEAGSLITEYAVDLLSKPRNLTMNRTASKSPSSDQPSPSEEVDFQPGEALSIQEDTAQIRIENAHVSALFSKSEGQLTRYVFHGEVLLDHVCWKPEFYRGLTDNDFRGAGIRNERNWKSVGLDQLKTIANQVSVTATPENAVVLYQLTLSGTASEDCGFHLKTWYTVFPSGEIRVEHAVEPFGELPYLPKVGMCCELDDRVKRYVYYGLGPMENYPDRCASAWKGLHELTAEEAAVCTYEKPQDYGNHEKTTMVMIEKHGTTQPDQPLSLMICTKEPMAAAFLPYTPAELENARNRKDLPDPHPMLHLDCAVCGLGNKSCGPEPAEFSLPKRDYYEYSYLLRGAETDAAGLPEDASYVLTDYSTPHLRYDGRLPKIDYPEEEEVYYDPSDPNMRIAAGFPS